MENGRLAAVSGVLLCGTNMDVNRRPRAALLTSVRVALRLFTSGKSL